MTACHSPTRSRTCLNWCARRRDGVVEALQTRVASGPKPIAPLLDKRSLANALSVSIASIDRLCRDQRIPYVLVGDVRRFDLEAVCEALRTHAPGPVKADAPPAPSPPAMRLEDAPVPGVRLLSRNGRQ